MVLLDVLTDFGINYHGILLGQLSGMGPGGTVLVVLILPQWLYSEGGVGEILFDTLAIGLWCPQVFSSVPHVIQHLHETTERGFQSFGVKCYQCAGMTPNTISPSHLIPRQLFCA